MKKEQPRKNMETNSSEILWREKKPPTHVTHLPPTATRGATLKDISLVKGLTNKKYSVPWHGDNMI